MKMPSDTYHDQSHRLEIRGGWHRSFRLCLVNRKQTLCMSAHLEVRGWQATQSRGHCGGIKMRNQGGAVIDSRAKFAWKLGSCRNYRRAINQRIMSQTRTRVVQTCPSFLDSCAGIFQSFARMDKTIFHAVLYNNKAQVFTKPIIFAAIAGFQNNTQSSRPKPLCQINIMYEKVCCILTVLLN